MKRLALIMTCCGVVATPVLSTVSPFAASSPLPSEVPPFVRMTDADYQPGFDRGMAEQIIETRKTADNPTAPTFDNTIATMERSGAMLRRVSAAFGAVNLADTHSVRQAVQKAETTKLAAHNNAIYPDAVLFARVHQVYETRATSLLNADQLQALKIIHQRFIRTGVQLSSADKAMLRDLNAGLSTLQTAFVQKLPAGTKAGALIVGNLKKLDGLGEGGVAAAAQVAKSRGLEEQWLVSLQNTTRQPALQSICDRTSYSQHIWSGGYAAGSRAGCGE